MTDPRTASAAVLRGLTQRTHELREQAEAMRAELAEVQEQVTSRDRFVTVTVGAGGILRGIRVEGGGQRASAQQIATAVLSAYGEGCRRAGERAAAIVERTMPGTPAVTLMREAVPPPSPEFEEPR